MLKKEIEKKLNLKNPEKASSFTGRFYIYDDNILVQYKNSTLSINGKFLYREIILYNGFNKESIWMS